MKLETRNNHVLMVGCGKMGGALLRQWVRADNIKFTVVDPAAQELPEQVTAHQNAKALEGRTYDMIIVAIKPQLVDAILPDYIKHLSENGAVLSMAAGCSAQRLSSALKTPSVIRIMPNLPSFIGRGVAGIYATDSVTSVQRRMAEAMMKLAGTCIWVDTEDGIDRITAVAGSGPGYVFEFARTYVEAAQTLGFSNAEARNLVLGTIAGTVEMALQSNETLETLRNNVTSKNGTTDAGLMAMNADGLLTDKLKSTVDAAYKRAVELR